MANQYNPINQLRAKPTTANPNPGWVTNIPAPSKYDWKLSDVSSADAGRTEDALMHKEMIAQKVHLEFEWQYVSDAEAALILSAFNRSEYLEIKYYDYKSAAFLTKTFYVGDRSVSTYSRRKGLSTITFNVIEQ